MILSKLVLIDYLKQVGDVSLARFNAAPIVGMSLCIGEVGFDERGGVQEEDLNQFWVESKVANHQGSQFMNAFIT